MAKPRARRRPRAVHFTHHACLELGPVDWIPRADRDRLFRELPAVERPEWLPAGYGQGHASIGRSYTTRIADVNCTRCREMLTRDGADWHLGIVGTAWVRCCRRHGAPSPLSREHTAELLAVEDRRQQREALEALARPVSLFGASILCWGHAEPRAFVFRDRVAQLVGCLDDEAREALRPAVEELLMAADVGDELERMLGRAGKLVVASDPFGERPPDRTPRAVGGGDSDRPSRGVS